MKKWLALLLAVVMVLGLTACGTKEETKDTTNNDTKVEDTQKTEDTTTDEETSTGSEDTESGETALEPGVHLPVTDEKVTFDMWAVWSRDYIESPNECLAAQELEARTNVHINYITVATGEATEKFGLMIASGDVPDMVRQANQYYPSGLSKAIDDGIFRDVTEEVKLYMPNYLSLVETHPEAKRGHISDDGRHLVVWGLNGSDSGLEAQKTYIGLLIRQDWLDDLGLAMPETIEDWHTTLTAFKNEKGAEAPLMIGKTGTIFASAFTSAFGVLSEFYAEDGIVKYGPAQAGYKEFLDTFRQWYAEGLIDPNFTANDSGTMADNSYMATGKAGAGSSLFIFGGQTFLQWGMTTDTNINFVGAPMPVLNKGDKQMSSYNGSRITGDCIAFASDIENLDVALKWLDYQYTDEAMVLNNYGIEGESYTVNENGTPKYQYTDAIMANPDGYTPQDALYFYCTRIPDGRYNWQYEEQFYTPEILAIEDVWSEADNSGIIAPEVTMTEEEGNIYNSKYTSIKTLVDEYTVNYILGFEAEDSFDAFVEELYQYGLEDCIEVQQAAYTRYMNR